MDHGTFNIADFYKTVANHIFISDGPMSNIFVKHFERSFVITEETPEKLLLLVQLVGRNDWWGVELKMCNFLKKILVPCIQNEKHRQWLQCGSVLILLFLMFKLHSSLQVTATLTTAEQE